MYVNSVIQCYYDNRDLRFTDNKGALQIPYPMIWTGL